MNAPFNYTSMPDWWWLYYSDYLPAQFSITKNELGGGGAPREIDYSWLWNPASGGYGGGNSTPQEPAGGGGAPYIPEGGVPTFPMDVFGGQMPEVPADPTPEPAYIPEGGIPTFPLDVFGNPMPLPAPEGIPPTVLEQPRDPIPTLPMIPWNPGLIEPVYTSLPAPPGQVVQPPAERVWPQPPEVVYIPKIDNPPAAPTTPEVPPVAPGGTTPTKPSTPTIPNLPSGSGSGAPGPGLLAPLVGDPNPKQTLFQGRPATPRVEDLASMLVPILFGGYNARS